MQINSVTEFSMNQPMVSARGEAEALTYEKIIGKTKVWYVSTQENRADSILVLTSNKNGMAGATLSIKLEDGTVDEVTAPWHTGSLGLFEDTGLDVRDTSKMSYIICNEAKSQGHYAPYDCTGILEHTEDGIMNFHHPKEQAERHANYLGRKVFLIQRSAGGGSAGYVEPTVRLT